ncbi:MAG: hypothetical protein U0Q18_11855 [Bryobacteraceae bacterium]
MKFSGTFLADCGRNVPGNMMELIDAMIQCQNAAAPKINELYIVYKAAQRWKRKHVNSLFASKQNLREEAQVNILMGEVIDDLNAAQQGLGTALQDYGHRKNTVGVAGKATSLGKGYHHERETYLASGKTQAPFSGSRIRDIIDQRNAQRGTNIDFHKIKTKTWNDVSAMAGQDLDGMPPAVRMYFLNKVQRLQRMTTCVDMGPQGNRWVDLQGQPMHTRFPNNRAFASAEACQIYAMDRYGNLFVDYDNMAHGQFVLGAAVNPARAAVQARGQTNHSSLCAGREVICAGTIFFWHGQLVHIDNKSGHYAPRHDALYRAVELVRDAGANIDYLRVGLATANAEDFYRARTFLVRGQADWPDQNTANNHVPIYSGLPGFQY